MQKKIAIFASGSGSNARRMFEHFTGHQDIEIALVVSNKKTAGVLDIAKEYATKTLVLEKQEYLNSENLLAQLAGHQIDFIVLAGFLWLVPGYLVRAFPNKIVNIHPSLLPKFGGKGMYGQHVHEAVKAAGERETGMTIHYVNEEYDKGQIIFQGKCRVFKKDTPSDIAKRVLKLEHRYFPKIVEKVLKKM